MGKENEGTTANDAELVDGACAEKKETAATPDKRELFEVSGKSNNFKTSEGISTWKAENDHHDETVWLESSVSPENSSGSKDENCQRQQLESLDETSCVKDDNVLKIANGKKKKKLVVVTTCEKELLSSIFVKCVQCKEKTDNLPQSESAFCNKGLEDEPSFSPMLTDLNNNRNIEFEDSLKELPESEKTEEKNILCIFKLVYGTCLTALRRLFMEIHPSWKNQPSDSATMDKGKMVLNKREAVLFSTGNIEQWDFSLLTTVLLYSRLCSIELGKRENYEVSIRSLKESRNKLIGHPSSDKMSNDDFNFYWPKITCCLKVLGVDEHEIENVLSDEVLLSVKHYRDLYLADLAAAVPVKPQLDRLEKKLDSLLERQPEKSGSAPGIETLIGSGWDEWLRFCNCVQDFDATQNQYILIIDALPADDMQQLSSLGSVPWKMVLDFDPRSEETGFYHSFSMQDGLGNLFSLLTPGELRSHSTSNLARHIDAKKMLWVFVNGRECDRPESLPKDFSNWESSSVKQISRLFCCCSDPDKFDKLKPVICLILPCRKESLPYLEVTVNRLYESFDEFHITLVALMYGHSSVITDRFLSHVFDLSPKLLGQGLKEFFYKPLIQEYRMPTSQAKLFASLSEKDFLYLKEYLEILYIGCHNVPDQCSDAEEEEKIKELLEEHRRSFMSGQWISFESLFDNHDARRETGNEVRIHIQRLLDQGLNHSVIVEVRHAPGTGGSTIARRVLWDLHKSYPSAIVKLGSHVDFDEEVSFTNKLTSRITTLEDICGTPPIVLIDGKHWIVESLSNKLVRMLNTNGRRVLILRCQHGDKGRKVIQTEAPQVHAVFSVNAKLEESRADLNEFEKKYKDYLQQNLNKYRSSGLCRVFHFPLMAMMKEFRPKLTEIVNNSFDEMQSLQQEIAVLVAFIQKYANQATPALLLFKAFKQYVRPLITKNVTYKDIKQLFTEHLLNLMVQAVPEGIGQRKGKAREEFPQSYTLQHRVVADLVLERVKLQQDRNLFSITNQFLQLPIYENEQFLPLFQDLFIHNRCVKTIKIKFSVLFDELKATDSDRAAEVFCEAAEKTNDPLVYSHAARFHAKKHHPLFQKAKQLIERAAEINKDTLKTRLIYDTKGVVLFMELVYLINTGTIKNLEQVEKTAASALESFRKARNFPPTYPNPLIGEVKVWLICIEWITKHLCGGDSDNALKFITVQAPPFFRTCISDSFYLLDIVDYIVQTVPTLQDPEETQKLANNARLSLMKTFGKGRGKNLRKDARDVIEACQALCSRNNFPRSSHAELKRLQAQYMLSCNDQIETLNMRNLVFLLKLLEELVLVEKEYQFAYHLMKVCVHVTGPKSYSFDQALAVIDKWSTISNYDCLPYFYRMIIYFNKILDGHTMEYLAPYLQALKQCKEKSQNHCKSAMHTHYIGKEGDGMSRLLTRSTLFREETEYTSDDSNKKQKFWITDSRKKLLECKGRIRMKACSRGRERPVIEIVQGNVELYVGKNADIGQAERNFTPGTMVYFVVSFNLRGPVANGITFKPSGP